MIYGYLRVSSDEQDVNSQKQGVVKYADGNTDTEPFADVVEMARLYILTDCNGSFETFSEWGLIRAKE